MTERVDVTVAIATLGRPTSLARCLDGVLAGTVLPREVIVVDQAADDETRGVVERRGALGTVVLHLAQERHGLSASRNVAIRAATASALAFTDDDCVPDRGWLAAVNRRLESSRTLAAVTGPMLPLPTTERARRPVASRTSTRAAVFAGGAAPWVVGTGANLTVRRDWLTRVGLYDERLGAGSAGGSGEDIDYIRRLLRAGARIAYEPLAVVRHEQQLPARSLASRKTYGRGIGACCGLWVARGDLSALGALAQWLAMRSRAAASGARRGDFAALRDELLMLVGTAAGLVYGARRARRPIP